MREFTPVKDHINAKHVQEISKMHNNFMNTKGDILVKNHSNVKFVINTFLKLVILIDIREFTQVRNHINAKFVRGVS